MKRLWDAFLDLIFGPPRVRVTKAPPSARVKTHERRPQATTYPALEYRWTLPS